MTIQSILRHKGGDVFSVGPGEDATSIAQALAQHRIGAALVRDQDGAVLGIVSATSSAPWRGRAPLPWPARRGT